ncbi:MAG: alpha/beta hydrolase [Clostridia bacterium]|nr:alpha/beta hydrolase [Clostridia bacterium]
MNIITENLWSETPGQCDEIPKITYYEAENKLTNATIIIFPGGGYRIRAEHEGKKYAEFFSKNGITSFVVDYRVAPHKFPLPLLDARRAVRFVRFYSEKYGIDKNRIAVMGSSAGGHLAALTSTYFEEIPYENIDIIDKEQYLPNLQILAYPVINLYDKNIANIGSGNNLIGSSYEETNDIYTRRSLTPSLIASPKTPDAFIWHTFDDKSVNVKNTFEYASALKDVGKTAEIHIFPNGKHGLGLADGDSDEQRHISQWSELLLKWLKYIGWYNK